MLTLDYLKNILDGELTGITNTNQIMESAGGYDGIVALIQTKSISPAIILEHNEVGEFSFRPGGFQRASQSIWVMKMVGRDNNRRAIQDDCCALVKKILSVFTVHFDDPELSGWVLNSVPYGIRNAGPNFTGYEISLHFEEDLDLSYHG